MQSQWSWDRISFKCMKPLLVSISIFGDRIEILRDPREETLGIMGVWSIQGHAGLHHQQYGAPIFLEIFRDPFWVPYFVC